MSIGPEPCGPFGAMDMFQPLDESFEQQYAQMHLEQEEMALDALLRIRGAGAKESDVELLAAVLGLSREYRRMARP
jgi:hypothetical protein